MKTREEGWKKYIRGEYLTDLAAFLKDHRTRAILAKFADNPGQLFTFTEIHKAGWGEPEPPQKALLNPECFYNSAPGQTEPKIYTTFNTTPQKSYSKKSRLLSHPSHCSAVIHAFVYWEVLSFVGAGKKRRYHLNEGWQGDAQRARVVLELEKTSTAGTVNKLVQELGGLDAFKKVYSQAGNITRAGNSLPPLTDLRISEGGAAMFGIDPKEWGEENTAEIKTFLAKLNDHHRALVREWAHYLMGKYRDKHFKECEKYIAAREGAKLPAAVRDPLKFIHLFVRVRDGARLLQFIHVHLLGEEDPALPPLEIPEGKLKGTAYLLEYHRRCISPEATEALKPAFIHGYKTYKVALDLAPLQYDLSTKEKRTAKEDQVLKELAWVGVALEDSGKLGGIAFRLEEEVRATTPPVVTVLSVRP